MKAHKRDIAAAWAKDWKPHGWERIVEANDPVAVNKSRVIVFTLNMILWGIFYYKLK